MNRLRRLRRHLTYANVAATVAIFLALGGGAYAVTIAPRNSVKSSSIKNRQVKSADLATSAVGSAQVANGSLQAGDISPNALGGVLSARISDVPTNSGACGSGTVEYGAVQGLSTAIYPPTSVTTLSPGRAVRARDLSVRLSAPPGVGDADCGFGSENKVNVILIVGGAAGFLYCSVSGAAETCTAAGPSATIPAGSELSITVTSERRTDLPVPPEDVEVGLRLTPN